MATNDFYVSFGSNAKQFAAELKTELSGVSPLIASLRDDLQDLENEARAVGTRVGQVGAGASRRPLPATPAGAGPSPHAGIAGSATPSPAAHATAGSSGIADSARDIAQMAVSLGRYENEIRSMVTGLASVIDKIGYVGDAMKAINTHNNLSQAAKNRDPSQSNLLQGTKKPDPSQLRDPRTGGPLVAGGVLAAPAPLNQRPQSSLLSAPTATTTATTSTASPRLASIAGVAQATIDAAAFDRVVAAIRVQTDSVESVIRTSAAQVTQALRAGVPVAGQAVAGQAVAGQAPAGGAQAPLVAANAAAPGRRRVAGQRSTAGAGSGAASGAASGHPSVVDADLDALARAQAVEDAEIAAANVRLEGLTAKISQIMAALQAAHPEKAAQLQPHLDAMQVEADALRAEVTARQHAQAATQAAASTVAAAPATGAGTVKSFIGTDYTPKNYPTLAEKRVAQDENQRKYEEQERLKRVKAAEEERRKTDPRYSLDDETRVKRRQLLDTPADPATFQSRLNQRGDQGIDLAHLKQIADAYTAEGYPVPHNTKTKKADLGAAVQAAHGQLEAAGGLTEHELVPTARVVVTSIAKSTRQILTTIIDAAKRSAEETAAYEIRALDRKTGGESNDRTTALGKEIIHRGRTQRGAAFGSDTDEAGNVTDEVSTPSHRGLVTHAEEVIAAREARLRESASQFAYANSQDPKFDPYSESHSKGIVGDDEEAATAKRSLRTLREATTTMDAFGRQALALDERLKRAKNALASLEKQAEHLSQQDKLSPQDALRYGDVLTKIPQARENVNNLNDQAATIPDYHRLVTPEYRKGYELRQGSPQEMAPGGSRGELERFQTLMRQEMSEHSANISALKGGFGDALVGGRQVNPRAGGSDFISLLQYLRPNGRGGVAVSQQGLEAIPRDRRTRDGTPMLNKDRTAIDPKEVATLNNRFGAAQNAYVNRSLANLNPDVTLHELEKLDKALNERLGKFNRSYKRLFALEVPVAELESRARSGHDAMQYHQAIVAKSNEVLGSGEIDTIRKENKAALRARKQAEKKSAAGADADAGEAGAGGGDGDGGKGKTKGAGGGSYGPILNRILAKLGDVHQVLANGITVKGAARMPGVGTAGAAQARSAATAATTATPAIKPMKRGKAEETNPVPGVGTPLGYGAALTMASEQLKHAEQIQHMMDRVDPNDPMAQRVSSAEIGLKRPKKKDRALTEDEVTRRDRDQQLANQGIRAARDAKENTGPRNVRDMMASQVPTGTDAPGRKNRDKRIDAALDKLTVENFAAYRDRLIQAAEDALARAGTVGGQHVDAARTRLEAAQNVQPAPKSALAISVTPAFPHADYSKTGIDPGAAPLGARVTQEQALTRALKERQRTEGTLKQSTGRLIELDRAGTAVLTDQTRALHGQKAAKQQNAAVKTTAGGDAADSAVAGANANSSARTKKADKPAPYADRQIEYLTPAERSLKVASWPKDVQDMIRDEKLVEAGAKLVAGGWLKIGEAVRFVGTQMRALNSERPAIQQKIGTELDRIGSDAGSKRAIARARAEQAAAAREQEQQVRVKTGATAVLSEASPKTQSQVRALGELIQAQAAAQQAQGRTTRTEEESLRIVEAQVRLFQRLRVEIKAAGGSMDEVREKFRVLNASAGAQVRGSDITDIQRLAKAVPLPPDLAAAAKGAADAGGSGGGGANARNGEQSGDEFGRGFSGGAQSAIEQRLFGNNGFWSRILGSTGAFIVRNFTAGFVFGLTNALGDAVKQAVETESTFVRVSDALDATGRSAGDLRTQLAGISTDYGVALQDVYKTAAGLTGVFGSVDDVAVATRVAAQMEIISGGAVNATEAMGVLSSITSAYGLQGADDLTHVADVLTTIQNRLGVNIEVTAEGVGRISGLANQMGLSFEEAGAYVAEIAKKTNQTGGAAGEQFSRILSQFETGRGQAALIGAFGKDISTALNRRGELADTSRPEGPQNRSGYSQALQILLAGYNGLNKAQQDNIALTLGGARQAAATAALLHNGAEALDVAAAATSNHGSAEDRATKISQQLSVEIKRLHQNVVNLATGLIHAGILDFFGVLLKTLNAVLGTANKMVSVFSDFTDSSGMTKFLGNIVFGALGAVAGLALLRRAIGGIRATIADVKATRDAVTGRREAAAAGTPPRPAPAPVPAPVPAPGAANPNPRTTNPQAAASARPGATTLLPLAPLPPRVAPVVGAPTPPVVAPRPVVAPVTPDERTRAQRAREALSRSATTSVAGPYEGALGGRRSPTFTGPTSAFGAVGEKLVTGPMQRVGTGMQGLAQRLRTLSTALERNAVAQAYNRTSNSTIPGVQQVEGLRAQARAAEMESKQAARAATDQARSQTLRGAASNYARDIGRGFNPGLEGSAARARTVASTTSGFGRALGFVGRDLQARGRGERTETMKAAITGLDTLGTNATAKLAAGRAAEAARSAANVALAEAQQAQKKVPQRGAPFAGETFDQRSARLAENAAARESAAQRVRSASANPSLNGPAGPGALQRSALRVASLGNVASKGLDKFAEGLERVNKSGAVGQGVMSALGTALTVMIMDGFRAHDFALKLQDAFDTSFGAKSNKTAAQKADDYVGPNTDLVKENARSNTGLPGLFRDLATGSEGMLGNIWKTVTGRGDESLTYAQMAERQAGLTTKDQDRTTSNAFGSGNNRIKELNKGLESSVRSVGADATSKAILDAADITRGELDAAAAKILADESTSDEQKASALANIEASRKALSKQTQSLILKAQGLSSLDAYTVDQIDHMNSVVSSFGNLNATDAKDLQSGIGDLVKSIGLAPGSSAQGLLKAMSDPTKTLREHTAAQIEYQQNIMVSARAQMNNQLLDADTRQKFSDKYAAAASAVVQLRDTQFTQLADELKGTAAAAGRTGDFAGQDKNLEGLIKNAQAKLDTYVEGDSRRIPILAEIEDIKNQRTQAALKGLNATDRFTVATTQNSYDRALAATRIAQNTSDRLNAPGSGASYEDKEAARIALVTSRNTLGDERAKKDTAQGQLDLSGLIADAARRTQTEKNAVLAVTQAETKYGQGSAEYMQAQASLADVRRTNTDAIRQEKIALDDANAAITGATLITDAQRRDFAVTEAVRKRAVAEADAKRRGVAADKDAGVRNAIAAEVAARQAQGFGNSDDRSNANRALDARREILAVTDEQKQAAAIATATNELARVRADPRSTGAQKLEAENNLLRAERAKTDARKQERDALREAQQKFAMESLAPGDAVARAQLGLQQAMDDVEKARVDHGINSADYVNAMTARIQAQRALDDAIRNIDVANLNLATAYANAADDSVASANIAVRTAQAALTAAQKAANGVETADVINARAAVIDATAAAHRAALQNEYDTIDFNKTMGTITGSEAVAALQRILDTQALTDKERQDLMVKIKGLQDDVNGALGDSPFNIGDITLPSQYEIKKALGLNQLGEVWKANYAQISASQQMSNLGFAGDNYTASSGMGGASQVYTDNSTRSITINGADMTQVISYIQDYFSQSIAPAPQNQPAPVRGTLPRSY